MIHLIVSILLLATSVLGGQNVFSVNDDVFAYPQYQIDFSTSYILEDDATSRLQEAKSRSLDETVATEDDSIGDLVEYEQLTLHGRRYLCSIPMVKPAQNATEEKPSKEDQEKELVAAADRGWQLLSDMEGKQCLYYSTGWWSYSFCYNSYVKQFHSLPSTQGGVRTWPPQEDQTTPSYILGRYEPKSVNQGSMPSKKKSGTELQTRASGNYLVQRLDGGTPCDLTGKNRRIEIEYHCYPQTTDRIVWIKETTTCSYLMVVYTPRLCNDIAFQPHRDSQAHTISCQEILTISEAAHLQDVEQQASAIEQSSDKPILIGRIEIGGMKHVGKDGKKLERGRIVLTPEEKAEIIIMQKDGQIQGLSRTKMKELNLEPEDVEDFKKELQKIAGSRDWKIERLGDGNGQIQLRGIVASDGGDEHYEAARDEDDAKKQGKKEEPKGEL